MIGMPEFGLELRQMTLICSDAPKPLFSPLPGDLRVRAHIHRVLHTTVGRGGGAARGVLRSRLGKVPIAVGHEPDTARRYGTTFGTSTRGISD
jgi:hypothetical protein